MNLSIAHKPFCDCFECTSPDTPVLSDAISNHADVTSTSNPGFYEGSTLTAKRYLTSYSLPGSDSKGNPLGKVVKKYSPGDVIGVIYSYKVDPGSNLVWWELTDNKNEWLLHQPGFFDASTAVATSSGKEFNDKQAALVDSEGFLNTFKTGAKDVGNKIGDKLDSVFGELKWIIVGIVVLVVIVAIAYSVNAYKKIA